MDTQNNRCMCPLMLTLLTVVASFSGGSPASAHSAQHRAQATEYVEPDRPVGQLIRRFRESGQDSYLDTAWTVIEPQLDVKRPAPGLLVDAAMLAQSRHDFVLALELLDRALEQHSQMPQAWLVRAAIELVRGNTDEARHACRQLRGSSALVAVSCHARVAIARGDSKRALRQLTAVLTHIEADGTDSGQLAWSLSVAGDAAVNLDPERAVLLYRRSLELAESAQVRSALVDVLLRLDRLADADSALSAGSTALPLAVRRLIVARREGRDSESAAEIARVDHRFRHWIAHGDWLHAREMARFYLDVLPRPELARKLALKNLELQREPEDQRLASRTAALLTAAANNGS